MLMMTIKINLIIFFSFIFLAFDDMPSIEVAVIMNGVVGKLLF